MIYLLWTIIALLVILLIIVGIIVTGKGPGVSSSVDVLLKEQFLAFQSDIHKEMNSTREELNRSKDIISEHTIKTIDTIKEMGSTIHKIIQQQEEAQKLGQDLKDVLRMPKLRGNYGEIILEEMLEKVLPKTVWERQYQIEPGRKVDIAIKFKDVVIPIDAKFPRDDYIRYLEAGTDTEKSEYWKKHETAVKAQIRSISSKYICPGKGTVDFALMFIPSEAVFYETIAGENYAGESSDLLDYAQSNHVIPVSPNTFYAFLQVILTGIQNLEIIKSARRLQENLAEIRKNFDYFFSKYEEMGKYVDKAAEAYRVGSKHIEKYRDRLENTLNLKELGSEHEEA